MADIPLESLFDNQRWLGTWHWLYAILYIPVGVILLILRTFIWLHFIVALQILPAHYSLNRKALQIMATILGLSVVENNSKEARRDAQVYLCNCSSPFDGIAVYLATGATPVMTPNSSPFALLPSIGAPRQAVSPVIQRVLQQQKPVAVFPEAASTNGRVAMLKFDAELLSSFNNYTMQGVVIQWTRPFPIAITALGASPYWDLAFLLALPYSQATVHYTRLSKDEDMQLPFSRALKIPVSVHTAQDKLELLKRKARESQQVTRSSPRSVQMAQQVQTVLPDVPLPVILEDLKRTQSVETTIARILDGQVRYTPIRPAPAVSSAPVPQAISVAPSTARTSTSSGGASTSSAAFGKTWTERGLSLQERKARFIEEARRKYIEKHGLQVSL